MIKKNLTLKGSTILLFLFIAMLNLAKVRLNVDGTVNINFGKGRGSSSTDYDYWGNNNNNNNYYNIGDITDAQYNLKPFKMNGKGYAIIKDYNRYYILKVDFHNGNPNNVVNETIFNARVQSSNCLSIDGDDRYCLTINPKGQPALWDRYSSRIRYTGQWLRNNYNYDNSYDYYDSNQHWFEW